VSPEQLADAYWAHYGLSTSKERSERLRAQELRWADEAVEAIVRTQHEQETARLGLLILLADRSPGTTQALAYLGAGPVEQYLETEPDLPAVERAAGKSERFRTAVRCAWFDKKLAPEDAARLRALGDPL
jgi:hypothetical protein